MAPRNTNTWAGSQIFCIFISIYLRRENILEQAGLESIERGTGRGGVCPKVLDINPFTNRQFGQHGIFTNQVDAVACGSENRALVFPAIPLVEWQNSGNTVVEVNTIE